MALEKETRTGIGGSVLGFLMFGLSSQNLNFSGDAGTVTAKVVPTSGRARGFRCDHYAISTIIEN